MIYFCLIVSVIILAAASIYNSKTAAILNQLNSTDRAWLKYLDKQSSEHARRLSQVECELQKAQSELAELKRELI